MSHKCPGRNCDKQINDGMLMCHAHWSLVPADLRRAYYATIGKAEHIDAITAAVKAVGGQP